MFTFHVPDADRTHYGTYLGLTDAHMCDECGRSSVQLGAVVERLRPHEAQNDKLGRWVGVEFEKGHNPPASGLLWIRFNIYRASDVERGITITHNYNEADAGLPFDNQRGMLVSGKWGFIWGRSVLLTDMNYANSVGMNGSMFVKYYVHFRENV